MAHPSSIDLAHDLFKKRFLLPLLELFNDLVWSPNDSVQAMDQVNVLLGVCAAIPIDAAIVLCITGNRSLRLLLCFSFRFGGIDKAEDRNKAGFLSQCFSVTTNAVLMT